MLKRQGGLGMGRRSSGRDEEAASVELSCLERVRPGISGKSGLRAPLLAGVLSLETLTHKLTAAFL